ncbi:MAG: hypothetical protein KAR56_01925 [Thermoplasmata archaeon]|nr:hypothetical protein [Thermoplasmata archaeon]
MALYLIRYGELGLKSQKVRSRFENVLRNNITSKFIKASKECRIEYDRGRIFLWADDEIFTEKSLVKIFGIVSFSKVEETTSDQEAIFQLAINIARPFFKENMSFCIRARRNGQHPYTSMELARDTGSAVFLAYEHLHPKVNLTNPDFEIFIEVRQNRSFVFTEKISGPGGMPLGTQGRTLGIVEKQQDIAACWPIMKRGCRVIVAVSDPGIAEPLRTWDPDLKIVGPGDLQQLANAHRTDGISLGWNIASYDARQEELAGLDLPVFFPLIGMADTDIEKLIARITG